MSRRFLSADNAASLLYRASCPDTYIVREFIDKAEFMIQTYATKGCQSVFFRVPVIYSTVPAYNFRAMITQIVDHFRDMGFFVKHMPDGRMWISWRRAFHRYRERRDSKRNRADGNGINRKRRTLINALATPDREE